LGLEEKKVGTKGEVKEVKGINWGREKGVRE